jgi:hypothetical protein
MKIRILKNKKFLFQFPPRMIAMAEISYLAHHLISMFEGPEIDNVDHFV